jgi:hypothetical protein
VDGTDVHFSEAGYFAECIAATDVDPVLELGCRLVRESEGDDIRRYTAAPALLYRGQQGHNPSRNNLGFAGAGARDNLKVALDVVDCSLLGVSKTSYAKFGVFTKCHGMRAWEAGGRHARQDFMDRRPRLLNILAIGTLCGRTERSLSKIAHSSRSPNR